MTQNALRWAEDPHEGEGVTLQGQLACAKRELALRKQVYPRLLASGRMRESAAVLEVNAMAAIVQTLQRVLDTALAPREPLAQIEQVHASLWPYQELRALVDALDARPPHDSGFLEPSDA